jgi:MFS transporter, putative metabolite:H+ symporter
MNPTSESVSPSERGAASAALLARMESVPFSRWHMTARVVMGSATFFDAFDALSLAFALPVLIVAWHISPAQVGILISASYVGQLAGALLFTGLAERIGRVPSAAAAVAIMSVMSLACASAWSYQSLLTFRLVQGVGIGGEMPVAAAYISELSRARGRGRFFLLYEMIFPIGLMATGQVGAWAVPAWGWQSMFLIGAVPGLLVAVLLTRLPESPRWLIFKGRLAEAESIVRKLESSAPAGAPRPVETQTRRPERGHLQVSGEPERSRWTELLSSPYRTRTLIVWALWACAYFVSNGLNNWMPSLYNTVYKLGLRDSLRAASMTNVAQVAVLLVCAFSIDRIGRRHWAVASFVVGGALLTALGIFGAHSATNVIIWGTLSYGIIGSANAVLYLYTPEIYPTRTRAMGVGLATAWLRIASAVGPAIVGLMMGSWGISSVFLMFAGVAVIGALVATRMIETRGRRLEEIAA